MTDLVRATVRDRLGHCELNRPHKLNALNFEMLQALDEVLHRWADDNSVEMVVLTGAGERGFCAGGDIADFHRAVTTGHHSDFIELLALEFKVDLLLSKYPKPLVTVAHGITMGGGIGLASHAPVRLVTATARMGMPETKIGYTPDVGGSHLLAMAPGHMGEYFAMTANSFTGADAPSLGFADAVVSETFAANALDELSDLVGLGSAEITAAVEVLHGAPESHRMATESGWIDHAFSAESPVEVVDRLRDMAHPNAAKALAMIEANSPTSVSSAFYSVRAAREEANLQLTLDRELRLAGYLMHLPDLAEGIRAQVIDKDRNPAWTPSSLQEVDLESLMQPM
ncbi:enoyl-CoA hydratase/isomerase family protein [Glutamicibacter endophyticus]